VQTSWLRELTFISFALCFFRGVDHRGKQKRSRPTLLSVLVRRQAGLRRETGGGRQNGIHQEQPTSRAGEPHQQAQHTATLPGRSTGWHHQCQTLDERYVYLRRSTLEQRGREHTRLTPPSTLAFFLFADDLAISLLMGLYWSQMARAAAISM
jgi:hypothetical protein